MTTWTYRPPTVEEGPVTWTDPLFLRVKLTRGITVLEEAGVYTTRRFPTQDELRDADTYYMGGHEYAVDDATKAALIAAGIATNDDFTRPLSGYGGGGYGEGPYGG